MTILFEMFRQRVYGRILEQIHESNFLLERVCKFSLHLDHQQRVPANIKEVVVHVDLVHLQHLHTTPPRSFRSSSVSGALGNLGRLGSFSGNGSARRSILPFGESGSAGKNTNAAGHHVLWQVAADMIPQFARSWWRLGLPDNIRHQLPLSSSPTPDTTATTSRTPACCPSTASISPSSMRKPAHLHLMIDAPRNSIFPSGR